jgi:hypothetical protein
MWPAPWHLSRALPQLIAVSSLKHVGDAGAVKPGVTVSGNNPGQLGALSTKRRVWHGNYAGGGPDCALRPGKSFGPEGGCGRARCEAGYTVSAIFGFNTTRLPISSVGSPAACVPLGRRGRRKPPRVWSQSRPKGGEHGNDHPPLPLGGDGGTG